LPLYTSKSLILKQKRRLQTNRGLKTPVSPQ
jgi:hypothetical protein